jgi:hypothetical protein
MGVKRKDTKAQRARVELRYAVMTTQKTAIFLALVVVATFTFQTLAAQNAQQTLPLKQFEVIRVDVDDIRRLPSSVRPIFSDPAPDGELVKSLDEAAKLAGFTPRLLKSRTVDQIAVVNPVNAEIKVVVAELTGALSQAKAGDVSVPQTWNGLNIALHQNRGILTGYGDFFIVQAPPLTMNAPAGFPLDQLIEVVFRIAGMNAMDARMFRQDFAANPTAYFPIPKRYDMNNHHVTLASGSGLLLQNAEKGGEMAFMWSDGDRSYFLSGLLTEAQAIAAANELH